MYQKTLLANPLKIKEFSGKRGIRTPEPVLPVTRFPDVKLFDITILASINYRDPIFYLQAICKHAIFFELHNMQKY